jgi:hypothetical protein
MDHECDIRKWRIRYNEEWKNLFQKSTLLQNYKKIHLDPILGEKGLIYLSDF